MGCACGKTTGTTEPATVSVAARTASVNASTREINGSGGTLLQAARAPKPREGEPDETLPALKLAIMSVEGLRPAAGVFVEVEVDGQPGSKVKTATFPVRAKSQGEGESARETFEADLRSALTLKEYPEGGSVKFTVHDSDPLKTEPLGTATVPDLMVTSEFWGKVPLSNTGEGYEAHLEVRFGQRHILVETAQELTNVLADTVAELGEVEVEAKAELNETIKEASKEAQQAMSHGSIPEVKEVVSHAVMESEEIGKQTLREAKVVVQESAEEVTVIMEGALDEVKETKGAVCCRC